MFSKRELEGYLLIDHRESEGLNPTQARHAGFSAMPVGRGAMFESPTINCSHCERLVVLNPDRTRSRGYCPKCDRYVCDQCEAERVRTGVCRPFKQVIDEFMERAAKSA
jgi:hypothetical protein